MSAPEIASIWRRTGTGAAWLLTGRLAVAAGGLVQVPIAFRQLGAESFGLWVAFTGLLWSLTILDGGLGFAVQNRVTRLLAAGRDGDAGALARWAGTRLMVVGAITLVAGVVLARWLPWSSWLGAGGFGQESGVPLAAAIVLAAAALNVPLGLGARLVTATQENWVQGVSTTVGAGLALGAFFLAAWCDGPLPAFAAASCVLPLATGLGTWWHVRRSAWWRHRAPSQPELDGLARESGLFFAPLVGAVAIGAFVPTLTAMSCGAAAAGTFGVLQRLFGFALQLQSQALTPAWPAYSDAAARGEATVATRTFRLTWWVTLAGFVLPTLALTPAVPAVIRWWLGANAPEISPALLWMMAGWHIAQFLGQPLATVLNGVGRIGAMAALGAGLAVITIVLGFWLGPRFGPLGILVALATPYVLVNLPVCAWQTRLALAGIKPLP